MIMVTETGCIIHKQVQYNRCEMSVSIFKCADCGHEFEEYEDTGCGG